VVARLYYASARAGVAATFSTTAAPRRRSRSRRAKAEPSSHGRGGSDCIANPAFVRGPIPHWGIVIRTDANGASEREDFVLSSLDSLASHL